MVKHNRLPRRPRVVSCDDCGERMHLAECGVDEHRRTRTRREQLEGRCPGRVYVHASHGGIDCWTATTR